ncbi:dirigent protein 4-like [Aristolochia californica]|uniref:dirigent protein 4-like n=1 Tax=Aristolochia californica TaxID=171875 RepID=UPI0035D8E9B2
MARKMSFFVALLFCVCFFVVSQGDETFACIGKEKVTNLHFFLYDILSGDDPMVVLLARPNVTLGPAETPFGYLYATDDLIMDKPGGEVIGNAQGLYVSSSKKELTLVLITDFGFTSGPYKGSSFSVLSRNPISHDKRELAVVGGRGKFRMARGFALLDTYFFNHTNGDAIIEYKVTLFHY